MSLTSQGASKAHPQLGEFDREILCQDCDQILGHFDHHAINVCKEFSSKCTPLSSHEFEVSNFDGERFAKFVLAVLWRASVSKRRGFQQVDLGPYEDKARDVLFGLKRLDNLRVLSVMVQRYTSPHLHMEGMYTLPLRTSFRGLNTYGFMLAGLRIVAKVDARPLPRPFAPFVINDAKTLRGHFIKFEDTSEFDGVKELAVRELIRNRGDN